MVQDRKRPHNYMLILEPEDIYLLMQSRTFFCTGIGDILLACIKGFQTFNSIGLDQYFTFTDLTKTKTGKKRQRRDSWSGSYEGRRTLTHWRIDGDQTHAAPPSLNTQATFLRIEIILIDKTSATQWMRFSKRRRYWCREIAPGSSHCQHRPLYQCNYTTSRLIIGLTVLSYCFYFHMQPN